MRELPTLLFQALDQMASEVSTWMQRSWLQYYPAQFLQTALHGVHELAGHRKSHQPTTLYFACFPAYNFPVHGRMPQQNPCFDHSYIRRSLQRGHENFSMLASNSLTYSLDH
uniref:Secreted protein n=1 Tax=Schistosoma curassoni TaxID=6186 RepID=A0A183K8F9_9TREM